MEVVQDASAKDGYRFEVKTGKISIEEEEEKKRGTKSVSKAGKAQGFFCVLTEAPIPLDYIRQQGRQQKMGARLMAVVAKGKKGRIYLSPNKEQEVAARVESPKIPEMDFEIPAKGPSISVQPYGMKKWDDIFTARQLTVLQTFSDLIGAVREQVLRDARASSLPEDDNPLANGGAGTVAYADAVATYLSFLIDKMADYNANLCT